MPDENRSCESWGRYPKVQQSVVEPSHLTDRVVPQNEKPLLPYGQGRSYGDVCLNDGGVLLCTGRLDRFISFDEESGVLRAEAGTTLAQILDFAVPRGWFLPVSPGTKFVSLGGAVANDIHGKNHHLGGTFGRHVRSLELERSDGEVLFCSPEKNGELFRATIAGLGLTGFIRWVEIQMKKVSGPLIQMQSVKFDNLDEFFEVSKASDQDYEYTVAWLDGIASGENLGRGIFMRGNHAEGGAESEKSSSASPLQGLLRVPCDAPSFLLNRFTVGAFNKLYYGKQRKKEISVLTHYEPFFYPLDSILHWNRIYGRRGFLQFQCVVQKGEDNQAIREILQIVVDSGKASFLAVMKEFGSISSPGMLSFPREGITVCLDFPFEGERTLDLFARLEKVVVEADGALYPAKDACMAPSSFRQFFPRWDEFQAFVDPKFSSSFSRRVSGEEVLRSRAA